MATPPQNNEGWVFVTASALVGFLGAKANQAITWWPLITSERNAASTCLGVLIAVTPRNEFMPLLHIAFDGEGDSTTYNPDSLKMGNFSLLVPSGVAEQVNQHATKVALEEAARQALIAIRRAQWEAERPAREAAETERLENIAKQTEANRIAQRLKVQARRNLLAPVQVLVDKYHLAENDLLSPEDSPTWVYQILEYILADDPFDQEELLRLRKSSYKYLAAAVHWRTWELASDPWNVVHSCSLLRQAKAPRKAVNLLNQIDISDWDRTVASAFFTTLGGAQRDAGALSEAWGSAKAALLKRDDKQHPYLLLGALCYQLDRYEEGDDFFAKARARGATEKDIEFTRREAESRRQNADANDID
ncbi:hypothetical protein [Rhodoferax sp.]|uniref:hypothetical protein n=1 Tax=Rhodoferax sp. TaxID=50421 RepID=UPI002742B51A|nr:hypothetical protein [Rhodoferax sp.]